MTKVKAKCKWIRSSALKIRRIVNLVRGLSVETALAKLRFTPHKAARIIEKTIKSAAANAKHNYKMDTRNLYILEICADSAGMLKRIRPRARGRAFPIKKRLSHLMVTVGPKQEVLSGTEN